MLFRSDNNGNVLAGGKIYSYAAGTTTPATVYTSSSGTIAHLNPIILDASGRVPGGEIWLTDGISYKFVVNDAYGNLIATYDNLSGINSNFVAFTSQQEIQTASAGQTLFTLTTMQYIPGTNNITVYVDGVNQYGPGAQYAYVETSSTSVTFENGLHVGASVKFTTASQVSSASTTAANVSFTGFKGQIGNVQNLGSATGSDWIGFTQAGTSAVAISAQDKMRQIISITDFGAIGDGVTDATAAIQLALNYAATNSCSIYIPVGTFVVSSSLLIQAVGIGVYGAGYGSIIKVTQPVTVFYSYGYGNHVFSNFTIDGSSATTTGFSAGRGAILIQNGATNVSSVIQNVRILQVKTSGIVTDLSSNVTAIGNYLYRVYEHSFYSALNIINNTIVESGYGSGTSNLSIKHQDMYLGQITGNNFINPTNACIQIQGSTPGCYGTTISGNRFELNTSNFAINIAASSEIGTIENNYFVQSTNATFINIGGGSRHVIIGNKFDLASGGVAVDISGSYNLTNSIIANNEIANGGNGDSITLRNSSSNNIISNNAFSSITGNAIVLQSGTSNNLCINNTFASVTTPISDSGTNNIGGKTTAASTGVGSVKMGSANSANNAVWIPVKYANTTYYVPAWTSATP